ncbi:MAG: sensor histidine kinase [Candidatus Lokiarchaeota archaeon]|nr:sensor histidine kinase [Candidatus Lokiarchaeota archaeon]
MEIYKNVDKIRIGQVITILLSNAIKNTPSKGLVKVTLKEVNNNIYLSIVDTGVGLTESDLDKLFKQFGKIERYGQKLDIDSEGSGLGLFISKEIIDLHGGTIWAESEGKNKGATFKIKLFKDID